MAKTKKNARKDRFLISLQSNADIPQILDAKGKLAFSFKYFDNSQPAGQDFKDWTDKQRLELLEKLHHYSKESKVYWINQRVGNGGLKVLEIYHDFPKNTDFEYPRFVPENVDWARFRLESAVRLAGFFVYEKDAREIGLSTDVFYIVFLDAHHRFYKMESK